MIAPMQDDEQMRERGSAGQYELLQNALGVIRARTGLAPKVGLVLGSGLGAAAEAMTEVTAIPYGEIPGFAPSTVPGHAGRLLLGNFAGVPAAVMQGRIHGYEGHSLQQVVFPVRLLCTMGIESLVLTNAAGSLRPEYLPGDLMLVTDHLNLCGHNPLAGLNDERLGVRFPDLSRAYDPALREQLARAADSLGFMLRRGVYAYMPGPSYETPAEIKALRQLGADAVGMSTVPEVIAAVHMRVRVAALSCLTNYGAGLSREPLSHAEVAATAARVQGRLMALLSACLPGWI